jgi:DNA-binding Xre family transcriptional regulator
MKYIDLQHEIGFSPSVTAKFQKNRPMNTESINKVCEYLHVQPSEIMEWIPDADYEKANAEKLEIENQIAELQAKLKKIK